MKYLKSDIENMSTKEYKKLINKYNQELVKAQAQNKVFYALRQQTFENMNALPAAEQARMLTNMANMFSAENMKPVKAAPSNPKSIRIPKGLKKELDRAAKEGNKRAKVEYDKFPDVLGGKLDVIQKESFTPLDIGRAESVEDVISRGRVLSSRASGNYFKNQYRDYKWHYIGAAREKIGDGFADWLKSALPDDSTFFFWTHDFLWGTYFEIEYIYDPGIASEIKRNEITNALENMQQGKGHINIIEG